MTRRTHVVAGLASACLLLGGCGGTTDEPKAAPDDVSTEIAPPSPTTAQRFGGQSLSEADTDRLTAKMTAALKTGNKREFLSVFDPSRTNLVDQQATWFNNVRKVPMGERKMVLVAPRDTRDSSGKGRLSADMGFQHQITGADPKPLGEWYSFEFKKAGGKLIVTGVDGATADASAGEKFSRYYRQPWDDGPMSVVKGRKVILLGPEADARTMRGLVGQLDEAVDAQVRLFVRNGVELAAGVRTRRWVFMLQSPGVADVFDYLGGDVKPLEADFLAFVSRVFTSDPVTGMLETDRVTSSRIVLDRDILNASTSAAAIRHEMVHALQNSWQRGYGRSPSWASEGAAVELSDASAAERSFRTSHGLRFLRDKGRLPTDAEFYRGDNDAVAGHYGAAYLACAYLVSKRGEKGLLKALRAIEEPGSDPESALGMSERKLAREALAWAS